MTAQEMTVHPSTVELVESATGLLDLIADADLVDAHGQGATEQLIRLEQSLIRVGLRLADALGQDVSPGTVHGTDVADLLERDQMVLHYQPVVQLRDGRLRGAEAFARWNHPTAGVLSAKDFVPEIERAGLLSELDRRTLEIGVRQLANWRTQGLVDDDFRMMLNTSPGSVLDDRFTAMALRLLTELSVPTRALQIEITETVYSLAEERIDEVIRHLHDCGLRVAMDDFGSLRANIDRLHRLPLDSVKIDGNAVATIGTSPSERVVVQTVVSMAGDLGIESIASGIETIDHVRDISRLGCTVGQGHYFGHPIGPEKFEALLIGLNEPSAV